MLISLICSNINMIRVAPENEEGKKKKDLNFRFRDIKRETPVDLDALIAVCPNGYTLVIISKCSQPSSSPSPPSLCRIVSCKARGCQKVTPCGLWELLAGVGRAAQEQQQIRGWALGSALLGC